MDKNRQQMENQEIMQKNKKNEIDFLKNQAIQRGEIGMYNYKQFQNVCIAYFAALKSLVFLAGGNSRNNPILIHEIHELMQLIQKELQILQKKEKRYRKHLFDYFYCVQMLKPHIQELYNISHKIHVLVNE